MPYLLSKNNTYNVLVGKTGESLFFKNYPVTFTQKPVVLAKSIYDEYTAQIDESENIHILYKSSNNSIIHLYENNNKFDKKVILDDFNNRYKIGNLKYLCATKNYLFYTATNPYEQTSDLIFHTFTHANESEPQSLFTLPNLNSPYECIMHNNVIYLLSSIINNNKHELNLYQYKINDDLWSEFDTIITQSNPIVDFSFCIDNNTIHIVFAEEQFGHFKIKYINKKDSWNTPVEILSSGEKVSPIIFIYNNIIWINWKESNVLKASLSSNNGCSFIKPIKCSAQSPESTYYYFYSLTNKVLSGNKFYGYVDKNPVLAILSQVDTDNVLLFSEDNNEIKSIIHSTMSADTFNIVELESELTEQKKTKESITNQYNDLVKFAHELQEEGKKWRAKYAKSDLEIKKLKRKIKKLNSQNNDYQEKEECIESMSSHQESTEDLDT